MWWSNDHRDYHLISVPNAIKREGSKKVIIRFVIDKDGFLVPSKGTANPFDNIVSEKDESEKAVIASIYLTDLQNDFKEKDVRVRLENVFTCLNEKYDENSVDNGNIIIPCRAEFNGSIPQNDALIWRTCLDFNALFLYAGAEETIFKPNTVEINMDEEISIEDSGLYDQKHALVHFIITNKDALKIQKGDFVKRQIKDKIFYYISSQLLERVRSYLKSKIFRNIYYTRFEKTRVVCSLEHLDPESDKGMVLVLVINYVVVNKN